MYIFLASSHFHKIVTVNCEEQKKLKQIMSYDNTENNFKRYDFYTFLFILKL